MLARLPESRRRRERRLAGILTSAVAHAAVILAVVGTARADPAPEPPEELVIPLPVLPPDPSEPRIARSSGGAVSAAPPRTPGMTIMPIGTIDVVLPPVDPAIPPIDHDRIGDGPGTYSGSARGTGQHGAPTGDGVLTLASVEKPVVQLPTGVAVRYPAMLREAAIEGSVNARFVVDTAGRVEPGSFTVLHSSHELFTASVRAALSGMRFIPAEAGGRKVRQLVEQRFLFELER